MAQPSELRVASPNRRFEGMSHKLLAQLMGHPST